MTKSSRFSQGISHFAKINVKFAPKLKDIVMITPAQLTQIKLSIGIRQLLHMLLIAYCNDILRNNCTYPNQTQYYKEIQQLLHMLLYKKLQ